MRNVGFLGRWGTYTARGVCLRVVVTLSLSKAGPGRFGGQVSVTDIYHAIPYQMGTVSLSRHCGQAYVPHLLTAIKFWGNGVRAFGGGLGTLL